MQMENYTRQMKFMQLEGYIIQTENYRIQMGNYRMQMKKYRQQMKIIKCKFVFTNSVVLSTIERTKWRIQSRLIHLVLSTCLSDGFIILEIVYM